MIFGREAGDIPVSPRDEFIATTWWTAHIAADALRHVDAERFVYLIQEYEPFTFAMGTFAALAAESYTLPHRRSSRPSCSRAISARMGSGCTATGTRQATAPRLPSRTPSQRVGPSTAGPDGRAQRRLLFYARPEAHAARNMFELGVLALARALRRRGVYRRLGVQRDRQRPRSRSHRSRRRCHDAAPAPLRPAQLRPAPTRPRRRSRAHVHAASESRPDRDGLRRDADRDEQLRKQDAGGAHAISSNLVVAEPTIEGVRPRSRTPPRARRVAPRRARETAWSRSWDQSFPDALSTLVAALTFVATVPAPRRCRDGGPSTSSGDRSLHVPTASRRSRDHDIAACAR